MPPVDKTTDTIYDEKTSSIPIYSTLSQDVSLVIDNGSYQCRAGWSNQCTPSLMFDNVLQKYVAKSDSAQGGGKTFIGLGNVNQHKQPPNSSRILQRTAFDQQYSYQFEAMELTLDGIFSQLNINEYPISHPIIMTEPLCNPQQSRNIMAELLFEAYGAPRIAFGLDSIFSYYYQARNYSDGIVLSSSNYTTHAIAIQDKSIDRNSIKRLTLGGQQMTEYLLKLMQLKYPNFSVKMTFSQASNSLRNYSYISKHYLTELNSLSSAESLARANIVLQYPCPHDTDVALTEEQLAEEQAKLNEKKLAFSNRMKEQVERIRLKKLAALEEDYHGLLKMKQYKPSDDDGIDIDEDAYLDMLKSYGYKDEDDFESILKETQEKIAKIKRKLEGEEPPPTPKKDYNFDILAIPDSELTEAQIKEKRRLKLIKINIDAREKARFEKEEELRRQKEEQEREDAKRLENPEKWLDEKHAKHREIQARLKQHYKMKESFTDRKSQASTQRLKTLVQMIGNDEDSTTSELSKKKRKSNMNEPDDEFGWNDSDWNIYHSVNAEGIAEIEERLESELAAIEELLVKHDPSFLEEQAQLEAKGKPSILVPFFEGKEKPQKENKSFQEYYQLHINIERFRVPEVLFQPYIIGMESTGIAEMLDSLLKRYSEASVQQSLVDNILLTGGNVLYPGLLERLSTEMRMTRPVDSTFSIALAKNPILDAWKGAAAISNMSDDRLWCSKLDYDEMGPDRLFSKYKSFFFVK